MKKIVKIGMFAFLGVTMSAGIVSCSDRGAAYGISVKQHHRPRD